MYQTEVAKRYRCTKHGEHTATMHVKIWGTDYSQKQFEHVYCIYCYDNWLREHLTMMEPIAEGE